jgi:mannosylglycoprotein endo-beta-mannosidase
MLNGEGSAYFKASKGLGQGDPLSPLIFNLIGDGLSKMLAKASSRGIVKGILEDFRGF